MKKLIFEQRIGGNYPSTNLYYTFDSKEEYDAFAEDLRRKGREDRTEFDIAIECEPRVVVSDGFATYGGKRIKARGCCEWTSGRFTSRHTYYIDPMTIEQNEDAKTETWWA